MRGQTTDTGKIKKIQKLREKGFSINEIAQETGKSKSVVSKYIQGVKVLPKYESLLRSKQGGSLERSRKNWLQAQVIARKLIGSLASRDRLLILTALYWGEGTKHELNIINSDVSLLKTFLCCIKEIGIEKSRIRASLRIFTDMDEEKSISYWSEALKIDRRQFYKTEIVEGKKKGKLPYGMCRLRVEKGGEYFKLLMSMIEMIKQSHMLP